MLKERAQVHKEMDQLQCKLEQVQNKLEDATKTSTALKREVSVVYSTVPNPGRGGGLLPKKSESAGIADAWTAPLR